MPRDPYGYQAGEPPPDENRSMAAPLLATVTLVLASIICLGSLGVGGMIAVSADEDRLIDKVGIAVLSSVCAWPAAATAFWTVLLLLGFRRPWLQAGPNVLLGTVTGLLVWSFVCCGIAGYAGATDPAGGG